MAAMLPRHHDLAADAAYARRPFHGAGAMDLLNTTYNKLERLAVGADQLLTVVIRRWESWSTSRRPRALDGRQLKDTGSSRMEIERIAHDEIAAGRPVEADGFTGEGGRQTVRAA
jgi:hypothetical protein